VDATVVDVWSAVVNPAQQPWPPVRPTGLNAPVGLPLA
jgi:hypothetical protein